MTDEFRQFIEHVMQREFEERNKLGLPEPDATLIVGCTANIQFGRPDGVMHKRKDGKWQMTPMEELN